LRTIKKRTCDICKAADEGKSAMNTTSSSKTVESDNKEDPEDEDARKDNKKGSKKELDSDHQNQPLRRMDLMKLDLRVKNPPRVLKIQPREPCQRMVSNSKRKKMVTLS